MAFEKPAGQVPAPSQAAKPMFKAVASQGWDYGNCAIIVAHPDDEIIWAGGLLLIHPESRWTIITLCKSTPEKAAKFQKVMEFIGAKGIMGDMEDSGGQTPLLEKDIRKTILSLLPMGRFDLILTHSRWGEYTRNLRHEETSKAITVLYNTKDLPARTLWMFSYEDGGGKYLPKPSRDADVRIWLPEHIWQEKYKILTEMYGFAADSFEAKCCPKQEAFWKLGT